MARSHGMMNGNVTVVLAIVPGHPGLAGRTVVALGIFGCEQARCKVQGDGSAIDYGRI
jgi:hypothetical protein